MNRELDQNRRRALGKGLSALLPARAAIAALDAQAAGPTRVREALPEHFEEFQSIRLEDIQPSGEQPRDRFDDEKMQELAQSIRANGVIQPITVYRSESGKYKLIAGERRWRASRLAGLTEIPALVRTVERDQVLELALIENIQREDLNPIETAVAFNRLATEHGLSHEQIAQRTGKDRSTITNFLRLLRLSPFVRSALSAGTITVGHARALLNIADEPSQARVCEDLIREGLSVRQTETLVKHLTKSAQGTTSTTEKSPVVVDPNIRAALDEMASALGTRVRMIPKSANTGRLEIEYYSQDDLDRIYSVIVKQ